MDSKGLYRKVDSKEYKKNKNDGLYDFSKKMRALF